MITIIMVTEICERLPIKSLKLASFQNITGQKISENLLILCVVTIVKLLQFFKNIVF